MKSYLLLLGLIISSEFMPFQPGDIPASVTWLSSIRGNSQAEPVSTRHSLLQSGTSLPLATTDVLSVERWDAGQSVNSEQIATLEQQARQITVQVLLGNDSGSGIIIGRSGQTYSVLTNAHVLLGAEALQVQTPDNAVHAAVQHETIAFEGSDLAIVQFTTPNLDYAVATFGTSLTLEVGSAVFAAGFPAVAPTANNEDGFKFTIGQISLISSQAIEGGYQVGYTNEIEKGMSGGPVLNRRGEVVAINGIHAYALWGDPYIFADGSSPCDPLRQLMRESSWAIPSETALQLVPANLLVGDVDVQQITPLEASESSLSLATFTNFWQTARLQHRAAVSQQCGGSNSSSGSRGNLLAIHSANE